MFVRTFNNLLTHKQGIAQSFSRAAPQYDRYATFQRLCGARLCTLLGSVTGQRLLDAGCGTGWFSRYWQAHGGNQIIALDLSPNMLACARQQDGSAIYLVGDIEWLPLATASIDIIFSNLALQWCNTLPRALAEFYRVLRPGGIMAISTLASGSLIELQQAWQLVDASDHVNHFLSPAAIMQAFATYLYQLYDETQTIYYQQLIDLLREIKGVGANYLYSGRQAGLTSRGRLKALEACWPQHEAGLPLSYHVIYGLLYRD